MTKMLTILAFAAALMTNQTPLPNKDQEPMISMGLGHYAILPNKALLASNVTLGVGQEAACQWRMISGPGKSEFEKPNSPVTWVKIDKPGAYTFELSATCGDKTVKDQTKVNVYPKGKYYGNPILPGMFPDPHIFYENGRFYIYATSMEDEKGAYGRASVWTSSDFVNWEMKLTNYPVYGQFGGDIWAPDIMKHNGKYYQFITRSGGYDTWIAVADSPIGPWRNNRDDNTPIVSGGGKAGRIVSAYNMDSNPFIDDDGQAYMYWGWAEPMAAKLTPDLKNIDGEVHFLKGTKWLPSGGELPQWFMVDLGESMPVTRTITSPEFYEVKYGYRIEVSDDGANWTVFADRTANKSESAGRDGYIDRGAVKGRYVRITFTECEGNWAGLYGFRVYNGDKLVSLNKKASASSSRSPGAEPANALDSSDGPNLPDFVEASYMVKRNRTYYLLYSSGALHDGSYSVHYATSKSPLGPFITPKDNVILAMNEEKTTKGPGHNSVLKFKSKYYIVYHQHNQPHRGADGVFRQACADLMEFSADGSIKKVVPTQTGVGPLLPMKPQDKDLARGKYAVATSVEDGYHCAEYALDGNFASKWRAKDNTYPQSLTVDLAGTFEVGRIETSFEYPTLSYKYQIETSLDGLNWSVFCDRTADYQPAVSPWRDTGYAKARFVRITITGCQRPENQAGIYTFRVFQR